jgi:hypothetical protein
MSRNQDASGVAGRDPDEFFFLKAVKGFSQYRATHLDLPAKRSFGWQHVAPAPRLQTVP